MQDFTIRNLLNQQQGPNNLGDELDLAITRCIKDVYVNGESAAPRTVTLTIVVKPSRPARGTTSVPVSVGAAVKVGLPKAAQLMAAQVFLRDVDGEAQPMGCLVPDQPDLFDQQPEPPALAAQVERITMTANG